MMNWKRGGLAILALGAAVGAHAGITLAPKSTFGNFGGPGGAGWYSPAEGGYTFLGTGNFERGMAYSSATNKLYMLSRNGGTNIRILNADTGADEGNLNATGISGGSIAAANMLASDDDGNIYAANWIANSNTSALKVYQFAPANLTGGTPSTTVFNSTITGAGTSRLGDSFDGMGSGAGARLVLGFSGSNGYTVITPGGSASTSNAIAGTSNGEFRLGVTFAGSTAEVWGKQTGATAGAAPMRRTTSGVLDGSSTLTSGGEMAMDYATVGGFNLLATLDANSSIVRIYEVTGSGAGTTLTLRSSLTNTSGTLTANGNATGQIRFGAISGNKATIYAMSTNQGLQAFEVAVPEPASMIAIGLGLAAVARRKKK